jgi:histidinol-phosphate aminotransferase
MATLRPYTAGEQPRDKRYIKLNTNENPFPPTGKVREYLREIDPADLRLYPDPKMTRLREALAKRNGVAPGNVFVGNGSDEVLSFAFYAFFDTVLFPEITYSFYPVYCDFYGIPYSTVPIREDFGVDLPGFLAQNASTPVILANPNSPTGMYLSRDEISGFLDKHDPNSLVVIDEAYIDFGGESCVGLLNRHKNLMVIRTFSKSHSLAGLRLGYAIAADGLIDALFTVKDSFNSYPVSTLAQELGLLAINDVEENRHVVDSIIEAREWTVRRLSELGWRVLPSKANFVFAAMPGRDAASVYSELKSRGILVRYFSKTGIEDFVRITIGTPEQMQTLIDTIESLS